MAYDLFLRKNEMNIHNFANRQLCEFQSIFPNVVSLLDHLLFVIGNGFDYNSQDGMIYTNSPIGKFIPLDQYPVMNDVDWQKLIMHCHTKERRWAQQNNSNGVINEEELAIACSKYKIVSVDDSLFTEENLHQQLRAWANVKQQKSSTFDSSPSYIRPYPLSEDHSFIFALNENTPKWFVQIAMNMCNAWIKFLGEEIEANNVWIKPSLRPKDPDAEIKAATMKELFDMIKKDSGYDGWLDEPYEEPQSDYADLNWTIKHRDMLIEQSSRLNTLLGK